MKIMNSNDDIINNEDNSNIYFDRKKNLTYQFSLNYVFCIALECI